MADIEIRKGMPSAQISKEEFAKRYRARFADPVFDPLEREISAIVDAAWDGYDNSRKSPRTRKAGPEFADPDYDLSLDWLAARDAIRTAITVHPPGQPAAHRKAIENTPAESMGMADDYLLLKPGVCPERVNPPLGKP